MQRTVKLGLGGYRTDATVGECRHEEQGGWIPGFLEAAGCRWPSLSTLGRSSAQQEKSNDNPRRNCLLLLALPLNIRNLQTQDCQRPRLPTQRSS